MPPVSESIIAELVDDFYGKIRIDPLIGPIFTSAIGDNWGPHLQKMKAFWSTVMLASRTYKGNPMLAHMNLPQLTREHFNRWLGLWRQTTAEICSEPVASLFVQKAETIAERLLAGITAYRELSNGSASGNPTLQTG